MKLVTFECASQARLGALLEGNAILDLSAAARRSQSPEHGLNSMQALIEAGEKAWDGVRRLIELRPDEAVLESGARLLSPLPRPIRIRDCCMYFDHLETCFAYWARIEADKADDPAMALKDLMASGNFSVAQVVRDRVVYYNCNTLAMTDPDDDILWPHASAYMDYELEWACVIGKGGSHIALSDARDHIFGYTIFNDWSARDLQMATMASKLGPGEGKDFANSIGPCIASVDEFDDPYNLELIARVNGEQTSFGNTASMDHSFERAIVEFSELSPLLPGELIGSGTVPTGCGFETGRKLADGDVVELAVEGIGVLRNRVVASA